LPPQSKLPLRGYVKLVCDADLIDLDPVNGLHGRGDRQRRFVAPFAVRATLMEAMLQMKKIDIAKLRQAYAG
jgi:hypothetical protein